MPSSRNFSNVVVPDPVFLLGVPIHPVNPAQLVQIIVQWGAEDRFRRVYRRNVHAMNLAQQLPEFKGYLRNADLVFCDGFGVKWLAGIANVNIPWRMTPPDWIDDFGAAAAKAGQRVFALGDQDGVAAKFMEALCARHKGLVSAGSHHGFFDKTGPENDRVIQKINESGAVHLLVGFGMPLQEQWIENNAQALRVKVVAPGGRIVPLVYRI